MLVICTLVARKTPADPPMISPIRMYVKSRIRWSVSVTKIARSMPNAAYRLPRRAVRAELSSFSPRMKQTAETRYAIAMDVFTRLLPAGCGPS